MEILDNSAVISRNTAPLLALAMKLLARGRKVNVSGTDISTRLVRYMSKLGDESMPKRRCLVAVDEWLAAKEDNQSKSARDMADCMRVFIGYGENLGQAIAYVRHVFAQHGTVEFMSGHKSKGLEFDYVYHLDQSLIRNTDQDQNLRYVIDTRSKDNLTYIESPHDAKH